MDLFLLILLILTLGAVCAAAWVLRARLQSMEARLGGLAALEELPEHIRGLAERIDQMEPAEIRAEVQRIRSGLDRVEALVAVPADTRAVTAEPTRAEIVRAAVTRHLKDEGYRSVQVLDEDADLAEDPVKVRVEAVRQGLLVKGSVTVEGERVTETSLDPSYSMFP